MGAHEGFLRRIVLKRTSGRVNTSTIRVKLTAMESSRNIMVENWGLDLTHYGNCIASYRGKGTLTYEGEQQLECDFEAGQLTDGEIVLLYGSESISVLDVTALPSKFEGVTPEGFKISAHGFTPKSYLPDKPDERTGTFAAFRVNELMAEIVVGGQEQSVRFGITNFKFFGTAPVRTGTSSFLMLPLRLEDKDGVTNLSVRPIQEYTKVMLRVQTLTNIQVTCEAVADIASNGGLQRLEEVMDNLCRLLSVARGTKIEWIYCDRYDANGILVQRRHSAFITKPYSPMAIIDARVGGRGATKTFLEDCYPTYVGRRDAYRLNKGTIDAYLDAKAESDYMESRGAKLAVALEKLKAVFLSQPETTAKEYIIEQHEFETLIDPIQHAIDAILKGANVDVDSRSAITLRAKIGGLNRRSFAYAIRKLSKMINLKVEERDLQLFIRGRNKLVHEGDFYCQMATPKERAECPPLPSRAEEYYFLVNFLDKVFLKLLGYSGSYVDYSTLIPGPLAMGVV